MGDEKKKIEQSYQHEQHKLNKSKMPLAEATERKNFPLRGPGKEELVQGSLNPWRARGSAGQKEK